MGNLLRNLGGLFSVKFEPISAAMADQKLTNPGHKSSIFNQHNMSCLMHIMDKDKEQKTADKKASIWADLTCKRMVVFFRIGRFISDT
jgi:hypothetical protein